MKFIKFDSYSNPCLACIPIYEQVRRWLDSNPSVTIKEIEMNESDAFLFYEFCETAHE